MVSERGRESIESVSWRKGVQVRGKDSSQGVAMPIRWTPWPEGGKARLVGIEERGIGDLPGKKRAVRGRRRLDMGVDKHLLVE